MTRLPDLAVVISPPLSIGYFIHGNADNCSSFRILIPRDALLTERMSWNGENSLSNTCSDKRKEHQLKLHRAQVRYAHDMEWVCAKRYVVGL
ncbi:hypothetical protein BC936DRAFT_142289 [Jimgerdemannia flammicorona]|uniref:Uncharacterized protein n=1 Tax=Jimgerdemannia flammicorona TaxID=994334 RepID=A0A433DFD6_9FUNG|nr:hypothetical protein BC936DRAFT_142289 [Jimgerdemannia flammicorona]